MQPSRLVPAVLGAALITSSFAREVRFEDCPPAVQQTLRAESKGGRIDEIDLVPATGRYVAEVDFGPSKEATLEVAPNGRLLRKIEDISRNQLPRPVRKTVRRLQGDTGRVDELERETSRRRVVYHLEIDHRTGADEWFLLSRKGAVLRKFPRDPR